MVLSGPPPLPVTTRVWSTRGRARPFFSICPAGAAKAEFRLVGHVRSMVGFQQCFLPRERVLDDRIEVVELGLPP